MQLLAEYVADRAKCSPRERPRGVGRRTPVALHEQDTQAVPGKVVERDVRLPRWALPHRRRSRDECVAFELRASTGKSKTAQECRAVLVRVFNNGRGRLNVVDQPLNRLIAAREAERRRLDQHERAHGFGTARRRKQRDDAAVGVTDEMCAVGEQLHDVVRIPVEVDSAVCG
jgi:hypothetical protein